MAWGGGNYSPFAPGEIIDLSFDFVNLVNGNSISSASIVVTCLPTGPSGTPVQDPNPQNIIAAGPTIISTKVNFQVSNGINGAVYVLNCQATLANAVMVQQWAELPCFGPPPYPPPTKPSIGGFYNFVAYLMGVPAVALPPFGLMNFCLEAAVDQVNFLICRASPLFYQQAVYNLAADFLVNWAPDQPDQTYFVDLRANMNINGFAPGVVLSGADVSTSESLVVPEWAKNLTIGDLQNAKTPWGRSYMAIAQQYGPTIVGLS